MRDGGPEEKINRDENLYCFNHGRGSRAEGCKSIVVD